MSNSIYIAILLAILTGFTKLSHATYTLNTQDKHKSKKVQNSAKNKSAIKHKKKNSYMRGTASHYGSGDGFAGRTMANGRPFDPTKMTAAHYNLRMGTKVKVTNLHNGRTVYVVITDRMPRKYNRIIDLSTAAAKSLGMYRRGLAQVQIEKVSNQEYQQKTRIAKTKKLANKTSV